MLYTVMCVKYVVVNKCMSLSAHAYVAKHMALHPDGAHGVCLTLN